MTLTQNLFSTTYLYPNISESQSILEVLATTKSSYSSSTLSLEQTTGTITMGQNLNMTGKLQLATCLLAAFVFIPLQIFKGKEIYGKSYVSIAIAWVVAFMINVISVSMPGRFDNSNITPEGGPWKSLFAPAPWAFAIWVVIYLTEALLSVAVLFGGNHDLIKETIVKVVPWWIAANLYQSIWCFTFRQKFINYLWLSAILLAGGAISLLGAITNTSFDLISSLSLSSSSSSSLLGSDNIIKIIELCLLRFPLSLHCGWLCAASLLNLNGWVAYKKTILSSQVAFVFASIYSAFVLGTGVSVSLKDPFFAFTIAWALSALAYQSRRMDPKEVPSIIKDSVSLTEECLFKLLVVIGFLSPISKGIF